MKFKFLLSFCMAGIAFSGFAQTHKEGAEYFRADQFSNAKELLLRNYDKPGTDKAVSDYYLGLIALRNGNKAEAKQHFDKGVQANPEYAYNYVGQGRLALEAGNAKEAETLFKTALQKNKKDARLEVAIAREYYNVDPAKYDKQITKHLDKARRIDGNETDLFLFDGDRALDNKEVGTAAGNYEMAANYAPKSAEAYVKYANLYTLVNPQFAINMLKKLIANNPTSALGQRELSNAYYNNKDYKNAVEEYGKYVQNPNHFKQDEDRYAFLLFYSGDYKKGYDYATQLLAINPGNFTAQRYQFMNAAQLTELKDQMLPMAEKLYAAHKANSDNKFAPIDYTLVADELARAGRPAEGESVLLEAIKEMPENANFDKQLSLIYVDEGKIAKAADAYKVYLNKVEKPGYNDFIQQAMFCYYAGVETKDDASRSDSYFNDAIDYTNKAAAELPSNYKPKKIQGDIAKQRAPKEQVGTAAAPLYLEAITMLEASEDPSRYASDAKEMYNYMGNYYLDQKNVEKAKEYFNKYLTYDPNNEDYRKFVENLK